MKEYEFVERWLNNYESPQMDDMPEESCCQYCGDYECYEARVQEIGEIPTFEIICEDCERELREQGFYIDKED